MTITISITITITITITININITTTITTTTTTTINITLPLTLPLPRPLIPRDDLDVNIELHDVTTNVDEFFQNADALIITSLNEVTPMVIILLINE